MHQVHHQRQTVRAVVRGRAHMHCEICEVLLTTEVQTADDFASMHHRFPRRSGGQDTVSGLLYLCRRCHVRRVHRDEEAALANGWLCPDRATAVWPVRTSSGWKYLAEDGHLTSLSWSQEADLNMARGTAPDLVTV